MDVGNPAGVVMPSGTAAVLRALAGTTASFTVRELARVAGVSHNRAHQVVRRLAEHGLVHTEEKGPSVLCRLNRDHLAADAVVALVRLRSALIELLSGETSAWQIAPRHASLFGSAARGDGGTESDLDVLLVHDGETSAEPGWEDQLSASSERIEAATGNRVAWFVVSAAELRRAIRAAESIVDDWRRDAIHLAGTPLRTVLKEAS